MADVVKILGQSKVEPMGAVWYATIKVDLHKVYPETPNGPPACIRSVVGVGHGSSAKDAYSAALSEGVAEFWKAL